MKDIVTKDLSQFLKEERKHYPHMTDDEFKQTLTDHVKCKYCDVYHWERCKKRCKCD